MMQMTVPDMVVICLSGVEKGDMQIASELRIKYTWTSVLCCGTEIDRRIAEALERKQKEREQWIQQAQTAPAQGGSVGAANNNQNARRHILLVDDNAIQLRSLRSVLVQDYDISLAISGEDAMKQMEKRHPDMLIPLW